MKWLVVRILAALSFVVGLLMAVGAGQKWY